MRTPDPSPRRSTVSAPFLCAALAAAWLTGPALAPAASQELEPSAEPRVELDADEARLELDVELDTAWALLLRALEPVARGVPLARPDGDWLQVHDIWVTAESVPWRDGTWTRLRVRVGSFGTELERARAESLLNTVQALWSERQAGLAAARAPTTTYVYDVPVSADVVPYSAYGTSAAAPVYVTPAWCSPMLWYPPTWWSGYYAPYGYYPWSYVAFGYSWDDWGIGVGWGAPGVLLASCGHYHAYGYACWGKSYFYGYGYYPYYDPWWHDPWWHGGFHYHHHDFDCDCGKCKHDCDDDCDGWDDWDGDDKGDRDDWADGGRDRGDLAGPTRDRDRPRSRPTVARRVTDLASGSVDLGATGRASLGGGESSRGAPGTVATTTGRSLTRPGTLTISTGGVTRSVDTTARSITLPSLTPAVTVSRTSGRVYGLPVGSLGQVVRVTGGATLSTGGVTGFGPSPTYPAPGSFGSTTRSAGSPFSSPSPAPSRLSSPPPRSMPTISSPPPSSSFESRPSSAPSLSRGSSGGFSSSGMASRGNSGGSASGGSSGGRGRR